MASSSTNHNRTATTDFQPQQQPPPQAPQDYVPNLSSYETGPANNTAGPHQSDLANKLDPRVDSDLNNRAQYAPGTTTATNSHPGATSYAANPQASNTLGPHESDLKNKFDPRVNSKTGEMTTKTTNDEGTGPRKEPVDQGNNNTNFDTTPTTTSDYNTTGSSNPGHTYSSTFKPTSSTKPSTSGGVVGGSSTGAPAVPSPASTPTGYSPEQGSYNPATGTGYTPTHREQQQAATQPATVPTAATTAGTQTTDTGAGAGASGSKGVAGGIKGVVAGIHGAGESIRGTFNAAVDRAFNEPEGVAKNEAIGREGEYEAKSGQFAPSTKQREGFNTQNRT
ncbi:hypothetical protein ZTR_05788 [Talaromyces verruculosus]|nr:hypothetical protein ZTR_05788 [Talaromyces verruculosus]